MIYLVEEVVPKFEGARRRGGVKVNREMGPSQDNNIHKCVTDWCAAIAGCPADCESCANSETCTRCRPGLYLLSGTCHHVCPEEFEPNDKVMECTAQGRSSGKKIICHGVSPAGRDRCHVYLFIQKYIK